MSIAEINIDFFSPCTKKMSATNLTVIPNTVAGFINIDFYLWYG